MLSPPQLERRVKFHILFKYLNRTDRIIQDKVHTKVEHQIRKQLYNNVKYRCSDIYINFYDTIDTLHA